MSRTPILSAAVRVLAVTALALPLLTACGRAEEAAQETAAEAAVEAAVEATTDAEVDISDGGQTITGKDNLGREYVVTQGEAATLPADFPTDVLVPQGLVLDSAMSVGGTATVGGTLDGEITALAKAIDAHMEGAGWTSAMALNESNSAMRVWQNAERTVMYTVEARDDGKLAVMISHSNEADPATGAGAAPSP